MLYGIFLSQLVDLVERTQRYAMPGSDCHSLHLQPCKVFVDGVVVICPERCSSGHHFVTRSKYLRPFSSCLMTAFVLFMFSLIQFT